MRLVCAENELELLAAVKKKTTLTSVRLSSVYSNNGEVKVLGLSSMGM